MFYLNYNGGPEIILSKNDDIYTYCTSIIYKELNNYAVIKEHLLAIASQNTSSLDISESEPAKDIKSIKEKVNLINYMDGGKEKNKLNLNNPFDK